MVYVKYQIVKMIFSYHCHTLQRREAAAGDVLQMYNIWLSLSGQFTLRDMYEQFQNIMKMGPFSQIMVIHSFLPNTGVHSFFLQTPANGQGKN